MSDEGVASMEKRIEEENALAESLRQMKAEEARKLISTMKIDISCEMPPPISPGTLMKAPIEVETNLFGIRVEDDIRIYRYDVDIYADIGRRSVQFTKKGFTDYMSQSRKKECFTIFGKAIKEMAFYRVDIQFFYDGQSLLFTLEPLSLKDGANETIIMEGSEFDEDGNSMMARFPFITLTIQESKNFKEYRLSDIRRVTQDISQSDRSAIQFVDLVTSANALAQSDRFTVFSNGKIFPNRPDLEGIQTVPMKEGKELVQGMNKSVKLIEGPRGRNNTSPALAVDSLKVAFHIKQTVIDKARGVYIDINKPTAKESDLFAGMIRGLGCWTIHTKKPRRVEIFGVSRDNSSMKLEMHLEGDLTRTISVVEYFKWRYQRDLQFPLAPLIMSREGGKMNMYPMELLVIMPMQRVTISQTTSGQSQVATKECAVPPAVRQKAIMQQCNLHDLFNPDQTFLKAAGLSIVPVPLQVSGRVLKGPTLLYKAAEMEVTQANWRPPVNYRFLVPALCEKWALYVVLTPRDKFALPDVKKFAEAFVKRCRERGMTIDLPSYMEILPAAPQDQTPDLPARMKIKDAAFYNIKFIFFISSDFLAIHNHVKLQESYSNVITQDLKLSTAVNFLQKNQSLTMDNIVFKTNIKLGGLNYGLSLKNVVGSTINPFHESRLIIGIGLSHAPPCSTYFSRTGVKLPSPSVVGYSANMANLPTEFIGDFLYQDAKKDDLLLCTSELMQNVIDRFTGMVDPDGKRKGKMEKPLPKEVIIYRQGVAEGFYAMCMREEIPLMKAVLARNGANECKLTYILVTKDHNIRLMPVDINIAEKATSQNIGSGVVIDSQLTHPRHREFFLNSHITLQGTARTPKYTVLLDDANMTMNQLQCVTHALGFNFQIVNSPVSIPAPLYIANRYAERGVAVFQAKTTDEMASSEQKARTSLAEMTEDLSYGHSPLGKLRINA